eukprot:4643943-Prymnesium_polylepis.2
MRGHGRARAGTGGHARSRAVTSGHVRAHAAIRESVRTWAAHYWNEGTKTMRPSGTASQSSSSRAPSSAIT